MSSKPIFALTLLLSYLVGAVPFGYLVARWRGVDILRQGSGNIGATNVGRVLGKRFGILVFMLDFAKGALPAAAGHWMRSSFNEEPILFLGPDGLPVLAGLAAFLGHLFPVYLRFHGGKGVATAAGVVAVLLPGPALAAFLTWLLVAGGSSYVSLASLTGASALCLVRLVATPEPFSLENLTLTVFCLLAALLVFVRHHANIARLLRGKENRLPGVPFLFHGSKTAHVLALGLWFGGSASFTFLVAPLTFQKFAHWASASGGSERERPPLPDNYHREMGKRLAGAVAGGLIQPLFLVEFYCGLAVAGTALALCRPGSRSGKLRALLAAAALAGVVAGIPLARKVGCLSSERYSADAAVAAAAQADFAAWHFYSLSLNLATLALVTVLMALAAQLPGENSVGSGDSGG